MNKHNNTYYCPSGRAASAVGEIIGYCYYDYYYYYYVMYYHYYYHHYH